MLLLHGKRQPAYSTFAMSPLCWIVPDTMGSQGSFYATTIKGFVYGSSPTLVAAAANLSPRKDLPAVTQEIKQLRPRGVTYLPGMMTPFTGVRPIMPNCLLEVDRRNPGAAKHRRFWPWDENQTTDDVATVYRDFRERLSAYLGLIAQRPKVRVSLTGGLDSTTMLAHLYPHLRPADFAFTYFNPKDSAPSAAADVFEANELASRLGINHRVLQWRNPKPGSPYAEIHRRVHPLKYASHGAAHAMWADLPSDFTHVNSLAGEIGTTMTRVRDYREPDPAWYARFWLGDNFTTVKRYLDSFDRYLDYTDFSHASLAGYDQHNVAYWELRIGKWGYGKFVDADQSHRCIPAFNDRRLLEIMLRLPQEHLVGKALYHATFADQPQFRPMFAPADGRKAWLTGPTSL